MKKTILFLSFMLISHQTFAGEIESIFSTPESVCSIVFGCIGASLFAYGLVQEKNIFVLVSLFLGLIAIGIVIQNTDDLKVVATIVVVIYIAAAVITKLPKPQRKKNYFSGTKQQYKDLVSNIIDMLQKNNKTWDNISTLKQHVDDIYEKIIPETTSKINKAYISHDRKGLVDQISSDIFHQISVLK